MILRILKNSTTSKWERLIRPLTALTQSEFYILLQFDLFSRFRSQSAQKPCLRFVKFDCIKKVYRVFLKQGQK